MYEKTFVDGVGRLGISLKITCEADPDHGGETFVQMRVRFVEWPMENPPASLEATSPRIEVRKNPEYWKDLQNWLSRFSVERVMDLLTLRSDHVAQIPSDIRRAYNALMVDADRWIEDLFRPT